MNVTREELEALSDDQLRFILSLVTSVCHLRFRDNTGRPKADSIANRIAQMGVGETLTIQQAKGYLGGECKLVARRYMRNPEADWKSSRTTRGLKIQRIK